MRRFLLAAALVLLTPKSAFAQADQQGAEANTVVPPRLTKDSPAKYPARVPAQKTNVAVELVLDVDTTGAVSKATLSKPGDVAFDDAAMTAAKALVFDPATRGTRPVASRIRFQYNFPPPPARLTGRIARRLTDSAINGATVVVRDSAGVEHRATTGPDGTFKFENLPFGATHIHAESPRNQPEEDDQTLEPGEETALTLRLAPIEEAPKPPPPGAPVEEPVQEVRVKAERPPREVTRRTISRDEIFSSPGTNGDALRAVQNLPGVARPPPFGGQLIVRGSAPQDTQTFIDGTNVPIIYHFGGLSSVVPSEMIEQLDFYPGNFGAQYGRGMGGVIDVSLRDPNGDGKFHGVFQYDSIDARLVLQRAIGKGWSVSLSGRRSYFDLWLKIIGGDEITSAPRYLDYQVVVRKEFSPDHDFRIALFGSDDRLEIFGKGTGGGDFLLGGDVNAAISFWRLQARYRNQFGNTRISAVAAVGQDSITFGFGEDYLVVDSLPISGRAEISQKIVKQLTVNAGIDVLDTPYTVTARFPAPEKPGTPGGGIGAPPLLTKHDGTTYMPGTYGELEITPFKGTRIVPGFRADYASQTREWNYSPRIVVRQDIPHAGPRTTLKGGAGLYSQAPQPYETDPIFGQKGLVANRSRHYSVGLEQELLGHAELGVEGFYKDLDHLVVTDNLNRGTGFVYGTEFLLRWKNDPKMFGWVAYTISRSERRDGPGDPLHLFQYDQTHVLTLLLSRAFGDGMRLGGRFRFVSGGLYTPDQSGGPFDADRTAFQPVGTLPLYGARLPAFHQLDLRFEKRFQAPPLSNVTAYIDMQNVYYYRAAEGVEYNYNYTKSRPIQGLPQLAIMGARLEL